MVNVKWRGGKERLPLTGGRGFGSPSPHKDTNAKPMTRFRLSSATLAALLIPLLLPVLPSCSVKEDRRGCPCWLEVALAPCEALARSVTVSAWNPSPLFLEGVDVRDYPDGYERTVPRGYLTVSVFAGRRVQELSGESLLIPDGQPCDSLWAHRALIDCSGEFARDTAVLHKQFASVRLHVDNLPEGEDYPYGLILRSRFDGLRLTDCSPHAGAWSLPLRSLPDGTYLFRVPRQGDGSLSVDLLLDGEKVDSYPIGEEILRSGYSWLSEDLEDIAIGMDYGRGEVRISVEPWREVDPLREAVL